jgi:hypothetical protein
MWRLARKNINAGWSRKVVICQFWLGIERHFFGQLKHASNSLANHQY